MAKNNKDVSLDRRKVLKSLGTGAIGTAAVATGAVVVAPDTVLGAESAADKRKARYQETDHVKAYYRTNRY